MGRVIGILGAGRAGTAVARLALKAGCKVLISNSRGPQSLYGHGARQPDPFGLLGDGGKDDGNRRNDEIQALVLTDTENVETGLVCHYCCRQDLLQTLTRTDLLPEVRVAQELAKGDDVDFHECVLLPDLQNDLAF